MALRSANILFKDETAGTLVETANGGTRFAYHSDWNKGNIACCFPPRNANMNGRSACIRFSSTSARKDGYANNRHVRHMSSKKTTLGCSFVTVQTVSGPSASGRRTMPHSSRKSPKPPSVPDARFQVCRRNCLSPRTMKTGLFPRVRRDQRSISLNSIPTE